MIAAFVSPIDPVVAIETMGSLAAASGVDPVLGQTVTAETTLDVAARIAGFSLLATASAATAAFTYRWYSEDEIPDGVAILLGVSLIAIWLNTKSALGDAIIGETPLLDPATAIYTVSAFVAGAIAADGGRRVGDHLARDVFQVATPRTFDEVSQLVRSAGRVISVELPTEIDDVDGYDPVDDRTKAELAGVSLLLPRRLTVDERRDRLVTRIERDYGVGVVDVDLSPDGTVEYLAVGSTPAGIGPSLAPGSVAVALQCDPAAGASSGDAVRVWSLDAGETKRITTAELRATAGDVATIAVGEDDVADLDPERSYRLVTLPGTADDGRALVSLLRAASETVATTRVDADGPLAGVSVDSLPVTVLALECDGEVQALPDGGQTLEPGDVAYLLGRPQTFRRLEDR